MPKNFGTQLSRQTGEHLVVAELGRLGIIATPFARNGELRRKKFANLLSFSLTSA